VAAAVAAVVAGFFTAWGAFRRQRQLGELKTNFVSAVSHELRAPIASIRLMSEELEDTEAPDPARSRGYHRLINQECRRLSWLIENVLDFSRHERGREQYSFQPTNVRALVEETVKLMRPCADEREVRLAASFKGDCRPAELDGRALQQALVNLIDNAIKHSPAQANVTVGLECDPILPGRPSPDGREKSTLRLWVEDAGEGIPPEEHERIFERFYRRGLELRRETQGIGLGLAIVRYIAQAHGGKVTVRSALGQGSRFTLEFPLAAPSQPDGPA
jgi:two-component system phosphate regulon sensor histidine kinase PhoR